MTRRGWVLFVALGIIWGLPYLLIKISVREVTPAFLILVRTAGASVILLPIALATGALAPVLRRWKPLVAYTCAEIVVPWFLLFNAEKHLASSLAGLLIATVPLVGAVLAVATGSDRLDRRRVTGLFLGLGGVAALVGFDVRGSSLWAALSLAGVAVGYALGPWIIARHLSDVPNIGITTLSLVLCALIYAPIAAFQVPQHPLSASVIWSMVTLTVVCTALAFILAIGLIAEVGPMRMTVITYVNPAVAVILGVTVLGEPFGVATAVGFALILAGSFLATRPPLADRQRADGREPADHATAITVPPVAEP